MRPQRIALIMLALVTALSVVPARDAHAVTAGDWKAGNIISDSIFTNPDSMSVSQIQSWLDARLKNCDYYGTATSELGGGVDYNGDGKVTRAEYGKTMGNPAPFTCLNKYYEVPKTSPSSGVPASNYGKSTIPTGAKSAARLIYDAAQAYDISPKVLLVKLGTESAGPLTSDTWPFKRQYTYAMGAHCPDSGPGGSANCDENYAGFSMQMREAAELLRWYLDSMQESWWAYKKPYQTNYILWNVQPSGCGGGNVYIQNKATAALYTYTPYQPNSAALNNMYGTGNSCSAYGNRNFWRVFNDWFGSSRYSVGGAIGAKFQSLGGEAGILGSPTMNEACGLAQSGCSQSFENGTIYWTHTTGAHVVRAAVLQRWDSINRERSPIGYPTSDETATDGGVYQQFQWGKIFWSGSTGAWDVRAAVRDKYLALDGHTGYLGFPKSGEVSIDGGAYQQFENGRIYWSGKSGAWDVHGAVQSKYISLGAENSYLGYPTSDETLLSEGGVYQQFQRGRIYWTGDDGARTLHGAILSRFSTLESSSSPIGIPLSGEVQTTGGVYQDFENARVYWSNKTGAWDVRSSMDTQYRSFGGNASYLGFPTASEVQIAGGSYQRFEKGRIYTTASSSYSTHGAIQSRYLSIGGNASYLGFPTSNEISTLNGSYQQFENGRIYWSGKSGAWDIKSSIGSQYITLGSNSGFLGYPISSEKSVIGGSYQQFQGGRIYLTGGSARSVHGGIQSRYISLGASGGKLGFPTSEEIAKTGGVYQLFQHGRIDWSTGSTTVSYN